MQDTKPYDASSVVVKKLPGSQMEIAASIPADAWSRFRAEALKNLNQIVAIDGFRKGNIPESVLVAKVGEMAVLEEMAELALPKAYVAIIIDQKIDAVGRPEIRVTKLAAGNPLEFTAVVAVVPEVKLPDYKELAAAEVKKAGSPDSKVSDKEIDDAILRIRKMHAPKDGPEPELTDDFVKAIGDFSDVPDFRNKLSQMLSEDKVNAANEKRRIAIADAIADASTVEIPRVMVESELDRTQAQFTADIERMNVKLDDYLKHAKKTVEDVRKEWLPHAEKKAKLQLILNEIAKKEDLHPTAAEIEAEVSHILEHYKDADRERAAVYADTVLTNEKVFAFLESQGA
jgi:trigger factor